MISSMRRSLIFCVTLVFIGACGNPCIKCENVSGYPNATICKDTYKTTTNSQSPTWDDYQSEAIHAGCVKQ